MRKGEESSQDGNEASMTEVATGTIIIMEKK